MNWNPFKLFGVFSSSKSDNPFTVIENAYRIGIKPITFCTEKQFFNDIAKVTGKKFEHCLFQEPLFGINRNPISTFKEVQEMIRQDPDIFRRWSGLSFIVSGEHLKKIKEKTPNGFGALEFRHFDPISEEGDERRLATFYILRGYYDAMRLAGKKKEVVKGLPIACGSCGSEFFKDANEDESDSDDPWIGRIDMESDGCCERCGFLAGKVDNGTLTKAHKYVREEEVALGRKIITA
jgi:hypothetical protein